jgi:hypothetical protein
MVSEAVAQAVHERLIIFGGISCFRLLISAARLCFSDWLGQAPSEAAVQATFPKNAKAPKSSHRCTYIKVVSPEPFYQNGENLV